MTNLKPSFYPTESECISAHRKPPGEEDYIREVQTNPELKWKFEVVPHFFKQDDPNTNDREFSYIEDDFGKLKLWAEITKTLTDLNSNAAPNECYKLIFCARHGQGYHNVAMEKYGTQEWRSKWNRLDTDGEIVWAPDPPLTDMVLLKRNAIMRHGKGKSLRVRRSPQDSICHLCVVLVTPA